MRAVFFKTEFYECLNFSTKIHVIAVNVRVISRIKISIPRLSPPPYSGNNFILIIIIASFSSAIRFISYIRRLRNRDIRLIITIVFRN